MKRDLELLTEGRFDLLVIGGGITGAGIALDATLRGMKVALIDKGDFAGGTSSVSSKLIHGGLRYLELGQFKLVYEALHERRNLLHNAPHLVRPLRFVVPVYQASRVSHWKLRLGLAMYDLLAGGENLHRSGPLNLQQIHRECPLLQTHGLAAGATYFDAQMDDARLCIEVVKTAAEHGACVANYVEAVAFEKREGRLRFAHVRDHIGGGEFSIRANQFVNAAGPWADAVCKIAGETDTPHLQPTKGVHLILPDQGFSSAFLLFHPRDGRVFFVIPWLGKTLVGTTDTASDESADRLVVTEEDVDYLLEGYRHYFTGGMERRNVLNTFVGLRPLMKQRPGAPSSLSREFQIIPSANGLISVVGGKYTTYRRMAELVVDAVEARHDPYRQTKRLSATRRFKLDGAPPEEWGDFLQTSSEALRTSFALSTEAAKHLLNRYGRRAFAVAHIISSDPVMGTPIVEGEPELRAEFVYQRNEEMAVRPADYSLRRTRLQLFRPSWRFNDNHGNHQS